MKIYCAVLINEFTGDLDHSVTSDAPIKDSMIPEPEGVYTGVPTIPPTLDKTWRKLFIEFDSDTFARGRDVLNDFEMQGVTPEARANPTATIQLKTGVTRFTGLAETTEAQQAIDHAAAQAGL